MELTETRICYKNGTKREPYDVCQAAIIFEKKDYHVLNGAYGHLSLAMVALYFERGNILATLSIPEWDLTPNPISYFKPKISCV